MTQGIFRDSALRIDAGGTHEVYVARVLWDEQEHEVEVVEMVGSPLVGIELLRDHHLDADMSEGGVLQITVRT